MFFIPNQEALDRLFLRKEHDLAQELMCPDDISGGQQGSVACYREYGKKNQANDKVSDNTNCHYLIKKHKHNWQQNCRIEFRLASASPAYNISLHILFIMFNILHFSIISKKQKAMDINRSYPIDRQFADIVKKHQSASFLEEQLKFLMTNAPTIDDQLLAH